MDTYNACMYFALFQTGVLEGAVVGGSTHAMMHTILHDKAHPRVNASSVQGGQSSRLSCGHMWSC